MCGTSYFKTHVHEIPTQFHKKVDKNKISKKGKCPTNLQYHLIVRHLLRASHNCFRRYYPTTTSKDINKTNCNVVWSIIYCELIFKTHLHEIPALISKEKAQAPTKAAVA